MNAMDHASKLIEPYGPRVPITELVEQLNRFYHALESRYYDHQHPEIFEQLLPLWRQMLNIGLKSMGDRSLRVLDFGCGTGFEATRLLEHVGEGRVERMVCYDLSPEMLRACRARLGRYTCPITFASDLGELPPDGNQFDVLLTNSVLHHLSDPFNTLRQIAPRLTDDAVWLAGHEPSSRYYRNPTCFRTLDEYQSRRRFLKFLSAWTWRNRLRHLFRFRRDPARGTGLAALEAGLVERKPPASIVGRLVNFHVAHDRGEAQAGRGFDFEQMARSLDGKWHLAWRRTYSFMGPFYEGRLTRRWRQACQALEQEYPDDGSNFCAVWQRCRAS